MKHKREKEKTMTEQEKEIKTIKERNISLKLSDADCKRVFDLCGQYGITVSQLLENFIGDLVHGTYTNGSDERMYASNYFRRCWFGMFPEKTFVSFLLWNDELDDFVETLESLEECENALNEYEKNPNGDWDMEEIGYLKGDIEDCQNEILEMKQRFLQEHKNANWEEEVEKVKLFVKNRDKFIKC